MGRDRLTPLRQFAQLGYIEIAVAEQRQSPWNRRRRHVQHVWSGGTGWPCGFRVERGPLAHPEAVLLVNDDNGEPVEQNVILDQGVRTDDD